MSMPEAGQAAERDERGRDDYEQQQARVLVALMQSFCAARYRKADNTPCPIEQVWPLAPSFALSSVICLSTRPCRGLGTDDPGARRWDIVLTIEGIDHLLSVFLFNRKNSPVIQLVHTFYLMKSLLKLLHIFYCHPCRVSTWDLLEQH